MSHALVLNASFEPLHIVTWQRAIQLLFQGKVEVVEESDLEVRSVRLTIKVPAVLRLLSYVSLSRKKDIVRFSRANIFLRDHLRCQYCGQHFHRTHLTLDHVVPIVQNGKKCWENIVTACKPCNQRKGGRTPPQAGMHLIRKPKRPSWLPAASLQLGITRTPEQWKIYLRVEKKKRPSEFYDGNPQEFTQLADPTQLPNSRSYHLKDSVSPSSQSFLDHSLNSSSFDPALDSSLDSGSSPSTLTSNSTRNGGPGPKRE